MRAREEEEEEDDGLIGAKTRDSAIKLFGRTIPFSAIATSMEVKKNKETGVDIREDDKISKKPAMAVPCPRCNSYETKFCYFNNYNVNQPRHFCKNCHRYWTAGGTMRNVPVGAGKRRNKPSDSANHPLISALEPCISNPTLLKSRPEKSLRKSMDSAIDDPSTSGSPTTGPPLINEFSEMVETGEGCFVKKKNKWFSENGNGNGSGAPRKHCRDAKMVEEDELQRRVSASKTLRVDDQTPNWASSRFEASLAQPHSLQTKF